MSKKKDELIAQGENQIDERKIFERVATIIETRKYFRDGFFACFFTRHSAFESIDTQFDADKNNNRDRFSPLVVEQSFANRNRLFENKKPYLEKYSYRAFDGIL